MHLLSSYHVPPCTLSSSKGHSFSHAPTQRRGCTPGGVEETPKLTSPCSKHLHRCLFCLENECEFHILVYSKSVFSNIKIKEFLPHLWSGSLAPGRQACGFPGTLLHQHRSRTPSVRSRNWAVSFNSHNTLQSRHWPHFVEVGTKALGSETTCPRPHSQ